MRLPDIATELRQLAEKHSLPRLTELAENMARRKRAVKAPSVSKKVTPEMADAIRAYKKLHPDVTQLQIGVVFGVNQGRVSEVLHGKRK